MVTTDVELQLTQQLKEAGKQLSLPPTSDDELLHVLDQTEKLLSMVDQSPNDLMKEALNPLMKCLVDRGLVEHSNVDVKVAVASCLSEMTRITAPEAPYGDEDLKDVFRLIVSTFEDLSDKSSLSYGRRTSILDTVCKVRSCVIMLDLECEELIVKMFENFLKSIREHHPDNVFSSMVDIMDLIFEESEDISVNMLKPLLFSIKNDSEVLPVVRKLGEKTLQKSRAILRPFLIKTLSILGDSLDNYSPVLAAICEGTTVFEQNDESALVQQQTDKSKLAKECSEEAPKADESKISTVSPDDAIQVVKENSEKPVETVATPNRTLKIVMSNGGRFTRNDKDLSDIESSKKPEEAIEHQHSNLISNTVDINDSVAELANVESNPESNKKGNKIDATMESVKPSDSSHENKDEKQNDNQVSVPEVESKPEETSNKEGNQTDVTMTSAEAEAEPSESSHGENKDEKTDEKDDERNKDEKNEDEKKDDIQVSVPEVETEAANVTSQSGSLPEVSNVEKVDLSNKEVSPQEEEAEVANAGPQSQSGGGLPYKVHIRKGPRSKKKSLIKDDTPLIDVLKKASERFSDSDIKSPKHAKKKAPIVLKDKLPATTATPEDGEKADTVPSGAKSEKKSGKKVGSGGSAKKKRKLPGKKSGGGGSGAKKVKQGGKKVDAEGNKPSTPLIEKDDDSDSFDEPLRQSKEDESDSDSKPIKSPDSDENGGGGSAEKKRKLPGKKGGGGGSGVKKVKQGGKKVDAEGKSKTSTPLIEKDNDSDSFDKLLRQSKEDESDSDSKPIKLPAKKGNKSSSSKLKSSAKNKDLKKNASGKKVEEKVLPEDDGMDVSPKPAVKTATEEGKSEDASVTTSKRKRSVGKNNVNKNIKYDDSLIGLKVKVWWPDDKKYYEGVIESFDSAKNKHKVSYVDGDEERLNLKKEKWEILQEFSVHNEEKPAEAQSSDDETLSKMITYKSKGKSSANAIDSTKSKSKSKSKSTGLDEKELGDGDGDGAVTPEKSTETKKSGSKGRKKRKGM